MCEATTNSDETELETDLDNWVIYCTNINASIRLELEVISVIDRRITWFN